jgi:hypothetical protein
LFESQLQQQRSIRIVLHHQGFWKCERHNSGYQLSIVERQKLEPENFFWRAKVIHILNNGASACIVMCAPDFVSRSLLWLLRKTGIRPGTIDPSLGLTRGKTLQRCCPKFTTRFARLGYVQGLIIVLTHEQSAAD